MRVRFIKDFRGKVTGERFFVAGAEADFADAAAKEIVEKWGAAEVIEIIEVEAEAEAAAVAVEKPRRVAKAAAKRKTRAKK